MLNWNTTKEEMDAIRGIAQRAGSATQSIGEALMDIEMDITACHLNGCKLDLAKLAGFDEFNFAHDVGGIRRHLDRKTGKLRDCFVPRSAA